MARATMASLISRLHTLLNSDTAFDDDALQTLLDSHATEIVAPLVPRPPFYRTHDAPLGDLEDGATVYYGYNAVLTETTDYTIDLQRGIVTTPAADYRGLRLQGTAYDLNAAAGDGWELIAGRLYNQFDFTDAGNQYIRSQQHRHALEQAATYRRKARAVSRDIERADSPAGRPQGDGLGFYRRSDIAS